MGLLSSRKAQIFTFEVIIAVVIFMTLIIFLNSSVYSTVDQKNQKIEKNELYDRAVYSSELLLRTEGVPSNWTDSDYIQLGLEKENFVVSKNKLDMLMNVSTNNIISSIGLSGYNLFINITSVFNYTTQINYTKGNPPSDPYILIPIYRFFLLDNETENIPAKMQMEVWR